MSVKERAKHILVELKGHAPFTLFGALLGIFFMLVFKNTSGVTSHRLFSVFHPAHVVLSAMVTASMFKLHASKKRFLLILLIGYFGSIGVATLSDIIIPHIGSEILGLDVPTHAQIHEHEETSEERDVHSDESEHHGAKIHLGFIEEWYIINPAAFLGVLIAYFLPRTKFPHAGHVLVSTWASSSYLLMNLASEITGGVFVGIFVTLFVATWLPCCISDIIFPLLFVKSDIELTVPCPVHGRHSHPHSHKEPEEDT
jgi:hypothetical protein